jgi:hypothetical protein
MQEDASRIRAVVEALHVQRKEVVVLCHSYCGAPTTQALAGVKVKRIVYFAAEAPKVGQSIVDASQEVTYLTMFVSFCVVSACLSYSIPRILRT